MRAAMINRKDLSPIYNIRVERRGKDSVNIQWDTERPDLKVAVYLSDAPDIFGQEQPAAKAEGESIVTISGLNPDVRYYFNIVPKDSPGIVTGERRVPLDGAMNFRDLGGYRAFDGRSVKWGKVFRSDNLSGLTDRDLKHLKQMNIGQVYDFRSSTEIGNYPDRLPEDGSIEYVHLPVELGEFNVDSAMDLMKKGDVSWMTDHFMSDRYLRNVDGFADTWAAVIDRLTQPEGPALVFHCSAGKDRAGVCAALVLLCLGVPDETIFYDHSLTNTFLADWINSMRDDIQSFGVDTEKIEPYLTAPRQGIESLLDHIRETYRTVSNYFKVKAGMGDESMALLKQALLV